MLTGFPLFPGTKGVEDQLDKIWKVLVDSVLQKSYALLFAYIVLDLPFFASVRIYTFQSLRLCKDFISLFKGDYSFSCNSLPHDFSAENLFQRLSHGAHKKQEIKQGSINIFVVGSRC